MSNNTTRYLKLVKPSEGAINWASSMNNNLDKIDTEYTNLKNAFESLFNSKDYSQSCIFTEENKDHIYMVRNDEGNINQDQLIIGRINSADGSQFFEKTDEITSNNYTDIRNFRAFYVYCGNQSNSSYSVSTETKSPYNISWKNGDICVVTKTYINGEFKISFNKIPQVLGSKYLNLTAVVTEPSFIDLKNGKYKATYTLNKGTELSSVKNENFPAIVCNCYIGTPASSGRTWEKIIVNYKITRPSVSESIIFDFYLDQNPDEFLDKNLEEKVIAVINYGDN